MNSFRLARAALRVRAPAMKAPVQRRGYAEAVSDKVGCVGPEVLLVGDDGGLMGAIDRSS